MLLKRRNGEQSRTINPVKSRSAGISLKAELFNRASSSMINPSIFKTYDIRGKYPQDVNERVFEALGQAFFDLTEAQEIVVGSDNRASSEKLRKSVIFALSSRGAKVIDIGFCTTPAFYWAVCHFKAQAGLMVTASHLEKDFNGLKPVKSKAQVLTTEEIQDWKQITLNLDKKANSRIQAGEIIKKDIRDEYAADLRKHINLDLKDLKIVMDAGNTVVGNYLPHIFKNTNLKTIALFWRLDSFFPNRGLDIKIARNRKALVEKIKKEKADLGFIWDGDADRLYILDSQAQVIDPSFVSAIIAKYLIAQSGRKKIVVEIRTSKVVGDEVAKAGGEIIVSQAWHTEIKTAMRKELQAIFGSETSGHYIFKDFYCLDDGILAGIYFLNAISLEQKNLMEILKDFKSRYFIIEETNFSIPNQEKGEQILEKIEKYYENKQGRFSKIDGLSIDFKDWRFNLRQSKTESVLRLNLEADSQDLMEKKQKELSAIIQSRI